MLHSACSASGHSMVVLSSLRTAYLFKGRMRETETLVLLTRQRRFIMTDPTPASKESDMSAKKDEDSKHSFSWL
jgi:hypothetical protein